MTSPVEAPDRPPQGLTDRLADKVWARWRLILVVVVVAFVLNNLAGLVLGSVSAIALAHRLSGRLIKARRMVEQVQRLAADSEERKEEG